ncbi:MAG TPA: Uma2 family endonuclease [Gemmataceae bacterium]|nr:Uma2 family endonuclease [Gemmataceae bacterium]
MTVTLASPAPGPIVYPESDGKPMADNTKQARWIVILFDNLLALLAEVADVFIAADLLWYPVEGEPETCQAPDVFVAFGRPRGDRGSYKQWEEGGIAPQVVFEILSPGNDYTEMADKHDFYEQHGVEEYYVYNPDKNSLVVYVRRGEVLRRVRPADGFVSPRLKIRFQLTAPEMTVYRPDGRPFLMFDQLEAERVQAVERAEQADKRAEQAGERAEQADKRAEQAEQALHQADERAEHAEEGRRQADEARRLAERQTVEAAGEIERLRRLLEAAGQTGQQE